MVTASQNMLFMEQKVVQCISVMWNTSLLCDIINISKLHDLKSFLYAEI